MVKTKKHELVCFLKTTWPTVKLLAAAKTGCTWKNWNFLFHCVVWHCYRAVYIAFAACMEITCAVIELLRVYFHIICVLLIRAGCFCRHSEKFFHTYRQISTWACHLIGSFCANNRIYCGELYPARETRIRCSEVIRHFWTDRNEGEFRLLFPRGLRLSEATLYIPLHANTSVAFISEQSNNILRMNCWPPLRSLRRTSLDLLKRRCMRSCHNLCYISHHLYGLSDGSAQSVDLMGSFTTNWSLKKPQTTWWGHLFLGHCAALKRLFVQQGVGRDVEYIVIWQVNVGFSLVYSHRSTMSFAHTNCVVLFEFVYGQKACVFII